MSFEWVGDKGEAEILKAMTQFVEAGALIIRDEVVLGMERGVSRSGRIYFVPGTRTQYRASAPGQPPAIRTAAYRNSWQASPAVVTKKKVSAFAFTDLLTGDGQWVLGELLEDGTSRMAPRVHVADAVVRGSRKIERLAR